MKNIILIFAFIIATATVYAQGSLQFNRVLFVENNTLTVPNGKVWKVSFFPEKIAATYIKQTATAGGSSGCTASILRTFSTVTEEFPLSLGAFIINNSINVPPASNGTFWLPEGTSIYCPVYQTPLQPSVPLNWRYQLDGNNNLCGPWTAPRVNYNAVLSVIEFNIIP
jgi:hypothetical protein